MWDVKFLAKTPSWDFCSRLILVLEYVLWRQVSPHDLVRKRWLFSFGTPCLILGKSFMRQRCLVEGWEQSKMKSCGTELNFAVRTNNLKLVEELFSRGIDLNTPYRGATPLGVAVAGQNKRLVQFLLSSGANPDLRSLGQNDRLEPPLITAVRLGNEELFHVLLASKALLNVLDFYGRTALWMAVKEQKLPVMKTLLEFGSQVVFDVWSECPLHLAVKYLPHRGRKAVAPFLIAAGCDPNLCDAKARNAFYWCIRQGDWQLFTLLAESRSINKVTQWPWLADEKIVGNLCNNSTFDSWLQSELFDPPPLKRLARSAIRQNFSKNKQSLYLSTPGLPLPPSLLRYLLLDIDLQLK